MPVRTWNIQAISELNRMEEKQPVVEARSVNILVSTKEGEEVTNHAAKAVMVEHHAAVAVARRQKRPTQKGIPIIAETFQSISRP